MDPRRWTRIEEIFADALELAPGERVELLDEVGRVDPELRDQVLELLEAREADPEFLATPLVRLPEDGIPPEEAPAGYEILRPLGHGGMGRVYLAERRVAGVRQTVALKILRFELETPLAHARFQEERRTLAALRHPAIATFLDAGTTPSGLPYFAMEYVEGVPVTEYARDRGLDRASRLRLMVQVCQGVQHAHRSLVVHQDLKPSNILVTDEGAPRLLDFGVSEFLDEPREGEGDDAPRLRAVTPGYAAPEQRRGDPPTIASDVFALGILLHEVLTGRNPFRDEGESTEAFLERIRDEPRPPLLSDPRLPGDLTAVVRKSTAPDPDDRYPSVQGLAEDLERFLEHRPLRARPRSPGYVAGKRVRRHWLPLSAAAVLLATLGTFTLVTLRQSRQIREEAERVTLERDKALEVRRFLLEAFGGTGADDPAGESVTARALLDLRAASLDSEYGDDPEIRAEMMDVLAEGYDRLGLYGDAEPLARGALALRRELFGDIHPDVGSSLNILGWVLHRQGRYDEARPLLAESVSVFRALQDEEGTRGHGAKLGRALNDLGVTLEAQGRYDEAALRYREALAVRKIVPGEELGTAITTSNLSVILYRKGELEAAVAMGRQALEAFNRALGPDHQRTAILQSNLAAMQSALGDHEGAARQYREILERRRRLLGPEHPDVAASMTLLASSLIRFQELDEAETLLRDALEIQQSSLGSEHPTVAATVRVMGDLLYQRRQLDEALAVHRRSLDLTRRSLGPAHERVGIALHRVGRTEEALGRLEDAERSYVEAIRVFDAAPAPGGFQAERVRSELGRLHLDAARPERALELLEPALARLETQLPPDHDFVQNARAWLARAHLEAGDPGRARELVTEALGHLTPVQKASEVGRELQALRRRLDTGG